MKRQRGLMRKYEDGDEVGSISVGQYQLLQAIELDSTSEFFLYCLYLCAPTYVYIHYLLLNHTSRKTIAPQRMGKDV